MAAAELFLGWLVATGAAVIPGYWQGLDAMW
jgi:hypothetical protein